MNKADGTGVMSKGEGGSLALKCGLGSSASMKIILGGLGLCLLAVINCGPLKYHAC